MKEEPSESLWQAQVLITSNENHKKLIDYSDTINRFNELDTYSMPIISKMVEDIAQYSIFTTLDLKSAYHQMSISNNNHKYTAFEVNGKLYQFILLPFDLRNGVRAFQRSINNIIDKEKLSDTFVFVDNITIYGKTQEQKHDLEKILRCSKEIQHPIKQQ